MMVSVNAASETTRRRHRFERRLFHALFATEDQKEGMAAFVESENPHSKVTSPSPHRIDAVARPFVLVLALNRARASQPSHPSAEKRVRQTARHGRQKKNRKARSAWSGGGGRRSRQAKAAAAAAKLAEPALMRGVSKGVIHKNTGARKVSRLSARLKTLQG
jgi:small subunit ribosomal protein S20